MNKEQVDTCTSMTSTTKTVTRHLPESLGQTTTDFPPTCISMSARFLRCVVCCAARLGLGICCYGKRLGRGQWRRGRQQLSPGETATVWGMGDALPGGREEVRDAGMQVQRKRRRRRREARGIVVKNTKGSRRDRFQISITLTLQVAMDQNKRLSSCCAYLIFFSFSYAINTRTFH